MVDFKLYPCLHPKVAYNKYIGKKVVARCGKCESCMNIRSASWVQRLDQESMCHKYTWFATFTYDEQHVPQAVRVEEHDSPTGDIGYLDVMTGQFFSYYDKSVSRHSAKDLQYVKDTKVLNIISVRDFQLFMKLLRKEALEIDLNARIRFYNTFEYGPSTFRPHCHTLFFFDSPLLSQNFVECVRRCWKNGCVYDPHPVTGSAAQYVASYVNSLSNLPSIYLHKDLCQKSVFSKKPPIGVGEVVTENLRKYFFDGTLELTLYDRVRNTFRNVPLWRSVQDRLYPRVQRFSELNLTSRIALYRTSSLRNGESIEEFAQLLGKFFADAGSVDPTRPVFLPTWFFDYYKCAFFKDEPYLANGQKQYRRRFNPDSVVRFARTICRVAENAKAFGISIDEYVTIMSKWYDKKEKLEFENYMRFQDEYFKEHSVREYPFFDYAFVEQVNNKKHSVLSKAQRIILESCGYTFDSDNDVVLSLSDCSSYRESELLHKNITFHMVKQKKTNDYVQKQVTDSSKYKNVFKFQSRNE